MHAPAIDRWHEMMAARDASLLDTLIAEDCVFQSPAVHTPQRGKAITIKYLTAAQRVLGVPNFRYIEEWIGPTSAVLEFELELDGIHVNGVDIIHWNADDLVTSFRVMIRPVKGLQAVMPAMAAVLDQLG
ncbi:MAG: nuclear transport factor 2 family protein [Sphingomonas sp.]|nr:nuclear transport factor 2 family protein [Sphingomonas sp.]